MLFLYALFFLALISQPFFVSAEVLCGHKGCRIERESETLVIFFRGHTSHFGRSRGRLKAKYWSRSAKKLLTNESFGGVPYQLQSYKIPASIYVTGSSHLSLSSAEIEGLMNTTRATKLVLAGHSGGYIGMNRTINNLSKALLQKVEHIYLLDNFYSPLETQRTLEKTFANRRQWLQEKCFGFVTPHKNNRQIKRYRRYLSGLCPNVVPIYKRGGHIKGIKCLESFIRDKNTCKL